MENEAALLISLHEKRPDYLTWEEYFMLVARVSAMRSKDPNTQVGACLVNSDHRIVGIGYNGFPKGCHDDFFPWNRDDPDPLKNKYAYVVHAEANAILNKNTYNGSQDHTLLYCTLFPCHECAKLIIQSGITEIIYLEDKYPDSWQGKAARVMFNAASISYRLYQGRRDFTITL